MEYKHNDCFECGIFTLSLDFELIWGTSDLFGPQRFRQACETEREIVIDQLLDLFTEFEVPATWCTVGHLFLDHCTQHNGVKHPEIPRPHHTWYPRDWFHEDPCSTEQSDPIFYGRSLLEKIRKCAVPQEIGCHTFSHVIFGDAGCSEETARAELLECVRLAHEVLETELRSFAFPRNQVGHLQVLRECGFACYRGPEPNWHEIGPCPEAFKRLARLWEVLVAARPPTVMPQKTDCGLWNIPGSMMYFPMHGLRRHIPLQLRVKRAVRGLQAAAQQKRIFHLWFHPTNMADETEQMFAGLRAILKHAVNLRSLNKLRFLPMGALAVGNWRPGL